MPQITSKRLFSSLLDANAPGFMSDKVRASAHWFRDKALKTLVSPEQVTALGDKTPFVMRPTIGTSDVGKLFLWNYRAKGEKELPYYDKWPMDFIVDVKDDYFYGLNLHYLPPKFRAMLMDALHEITNNDKYDKTTKVILSYKLLKNSSELRYYAPCFKKYLKSHVQSRFLYVNPSQWDIAVFLPLARWNKADDMTVWMDSVAQINKAKFRT